jgi:6-phosphogluconolactonase/glucosamine-6-phosphate isomerase/deaminase
MNFLREDMGMATHAIAKAICDGLFAQKRVLWLVSGGSNTGAEKDIMDMVSRHASPRLGGLAILPIDERFGESGHKDSNIQQLRDAGLNPGAATVVDILIHNLPFEQTVSFYNDVAATALANADIIIGQFGMGADGHIAGIKPNSPATELDDATVAGYEWEDYTRLTLTAAALRQVTVGFLLAYGADKRKALLALRRHTTAFAKLPAVLLSELPEVYVYNDQIGNKE